MKYVGRLTKSDIQPSVQTPPQKKNGYHCWHLLASMTLPIRRVSSSCLGIVGMTSQRQVPVFIFHCSVPRIAFPLQVPSHAKISMSRGTIHLNEREAIDCPGSAASPKRSVSSARPNSPDSTVPSDLILLQLTCSSSQFMAGRMIADRLMLLTAIPVSRPKTRNLALPKFGLWERLVSAATPRDEAESEKKTKNKLMQCCNSQADRNSEALQQNIGASPYFAGLAALMP